MTPKRGSHDARAGTGSTRLYNRIAVLRAERELSRSELAEAVGVNYQTIGYLERGEYNPSLQLALRLAELFDLPIEAIFSREPLRPMSEELYAPDRDRAVRTT
ncbi:MAG TPA: helix-turn-helix transcriptional regulator [Candidatus Dormibacteraeota bacterium]|nr:helix-turn-helix transcriptional regulator [Candidatus Dormibacteraeota bacterium]